MILGYGPGGRNPAPTNGGKLVTKEVGGGVLDAPRRGGNGKAAGGIYAAPTEQ